MRLRQRSEYQRQRAELERNILRVQITISDRLTPALRRAAVAVERWDAVANRRWNRYQMRADLGRD